MQPKTLGELLWKVRHQRGLTIRDLSQLSGVNPKTISAAEQDTQHPRKRTLQKIATALEIDMATVNQFAGPPPTRTSRWDLLITEGATGGNL